MRTIGAIVLLLAIASPAASAASKKPAAGGGSSGADVSLGYSYEHSGEANLNGWQLTGSLPLTRSLRGVVDLGGHYGSFGGADLDDLAFFAGPRWTFGGKRLFPFAEGLIGIVRRGASAAGVSSSDTDWGLALGGGVDYRVGRAWAVRGQADLLLIRGEGVTDTDPRLSVAAVYRFGPR